MILVQKCYVVVDVSGRRSLSLSLWERGDGVSGRRERQRLTLMVEYITKKWVLDLPFFLSLSLSLSVSPFPSPSVKSIGLFPTFASFFLL